MTIRGIPNDGTDNRQRQNRTEDDEHQPGNYGEESSYCLN